MMTNDRKRRRILWSEIAGAVGISAGLIALWVMAVRIFMSVLGVSFFE